jgi:hypothetical protein
VSPKFGSKLPLTLTVTETGEPPICPESVALLLPDHLFEFAWVTGRCRRLPLGRNSPKLAMQRLDSIHLDCETSIAPVAKRRRKSLNVPMSLTEDAEAKAKKDGCLFSKQDNETMLSNQITCGKWQFEVQILCPYLSYPKVRPVYQKGLTAALFQSSLLAGPHGFLPRVGTRPSLLISPFPQ